MSTNVLNSWKEIAIYVGRGVRTLQRWELELGFPVRRPRGKHRSAVLAIKSEIDLWLQTSHGDAVPGRNEILELQWRPARKCELLLANTNGAHPCYDFLKKELKRTIAIGSALQATVESNKARKLKTDALRNERRLRLDLLKKETHRARVLAGILRASTASGRGNGNGVSLELMSDFAGGALSKPVLGTIKCLT